MDKGMLHYLSAINQQIEAHETVLLHIYDIEALFEPLLVGNLLDFPLHVLDQCDSGLDNSALADCSRQQAYWQLSDHPVRSIGHTRTPSLEHHHVCDTR